jgi:hypothetical protein
MMMGKMMAQQSGLEIILPSIILPEFGVSRWLITGSLGPTSECRDKNIHRVEGTFRTDHLPQWGKGAEVQRFDTL